VNEQIVESLNGLIATELVAVNQYFVHAKLCEHWGFGKLASHLRDDSIDEMRDVELYMDRVLLLGGLPNLQRLDSFRVGENVREVLDLGIELETRAVEQIKEAVRLADGLGDVGTLELVSPRVPSEEEQLDWLRIQRTLLDQLGEELYLSLQVET
jgi:bacterioferritin